MFAPFAFEMIETKEILEGLILVERAFLNLFVQFGNVMKAVSLSQSEQFAFDEVQVSLQVNFQTLPFQFFRQDVQLRRDLFE